jgi:GTP-binding protein Era
MTGAPLDDRFPPTRHHQTDDKDPLSNPDPNAEMRRCGFVAFVGAPNAGKSTLLNALVGAKISIVTPKVQTTRTRVLGIAIDGPAQLVFVDTPGIFAPKRRLDRAMVAAAWQGAMDADIICILGDCPVLAKGADPNTDRIVADLEKAGRKAVLVLNKVDLVKKDKLLAIAQRFDATNVFSDIFMVSALTGDGLGDLRAFFARAVPEGPWLFPEDQISDMSERLIAAEITREQLFLQLSQELPYSLTVETESWEDRPDGSVRIEQVVYVQRDSQRAIVLGKGGQRIKAVGAAARQELEAMMDRKVHLFLFVKVREGWQDDPERYRDWGLDYNA